MPRRKTTEEFINDAKNIHGNKYDYSSVNYMGGKTKIIIKCYIHGEFNQVPHDHLDGCGCQKCGIENRIKLRKKTIKRFIEDAIKIHGDKYDYSEVKYKNNNTKIKIICNICNSLFYQIPNSHLNGAGCPICNGGIKKTKQDFIKKSRKIHGDKYDYSLVNYKTARISVEIICKKHEYIFKQTPDNHIRGQGCPKCGIDSKSVFFSMGKKEFVKRSIEIHADKYDYSLVNYTNNLTKVKIICPQHNIFEQSPSNHLSGKGCYHCSESRGEKYIRINLKKKEIDFIPQKVFYDCRDKHPLKFDFYLPVYNLLIEYNGIQHYKSSKFFGGEKGFKSLQKRDKIKIDYCKNNNISLYIIKYDEKIEDKLNLLLENYLLLK